MGRLRRLSKQSNFHGRHEMTSFQKNAESTSTPAKLKRFAWAAAAGETGGMVDL
jgi:hypothetical protein